MLPPAPFSTPSRLEELDPNTFETRAAELLHGLGFSRIMMARKTKDMSGECSGRFGVFWGKIEGFGVEGLGQGRGLQPHHDGAQDQGHVR
jgi:hypothetical protein